jgi:hypothetical protein
LKPVSVIASVLLAAIAASPAAACRLPSAVSAVIHSQLPDPLPADLVAAEIEFKESLDTGSFRRFGGEARVIRAIQGSLPRKSLWISSAGGRTSCHYAFANGRRGLVVGRLTRGKRGAVLEPVWVVRRNGFRMP